MTISGRASEGDERGDGRMVRINAGTIFAAVADTVCEHVAYHARMRNEGG